MPSLQRGVEVEPFHHIPSVDLLSEPVKEIYLAIHVFRVVYYWVVGKLVGKILVGRYIGRYFTICLVVGRSQNPTGMSSPGSLWNSLLRCQTGGRTMCIQSRGKYPNLSYFPLQTNNISRCQQGQWIPPTHLLMRRQNQLMTPATWSAITNRKNRRSREKSNI